MFLLTPSGSPSAAEGSRIMQWRHRKPIYDAVVTSFIELGRTGPRERWHKHDVSDDQPAAQPAPLSRSILMAAPTSPKSSIARSEPVCADPSIIRYAVPEADELILMTIRPNLAS